ALDSPSAPAPACPQSVPSPSRRANPSYAPALCLISSPHPPPSTPTAPAAPLLYPAAYLQSSHPPAHENPYAAPSRGRLHPAESPAYPSLPPHRSSRVSRQTSPWTTGSPQSHESKTSPPA